MNNQELIEKDRSISSLSELSDYELYNIRCMIALGYIPAFSPNEYYWETRRRIYE